jgi:hypothetical protein
MLAPMEPDSDVHSGLSDGRTRLIIVVSAAVLATVVALVFRFFVGDHDAIIWLFLVMTPAAIWALAAPTVEWAAGIASALVVTLVGLVLVSRAVSGSATAAAPPLDWLLPYLVAATVIGIVATRRGRGRGRGGTWAVLVSAAMAAAVGAILWLAAAGGVFLPAVDAAPAGVAWSIADPGSLDCSDDGGLCTRTVVLDTTLSPAQVADGLRAHGWTGACATVTGLLSRIHLVRYGQRCLSVAANASGQVTVTLLGESARWLDQAHAAPPTARS